MTKIQAAVYAGLLAVTACAAVDDSARLPPQQIDDSFDAVDQRYRTSFGTPVTLRYYIKAFDSDGYIAVCGGREMRPQQGVLESVWALWVREANVAIDRPDNIVASARFFSDVMPGMRDQIAYCVRTNQKYPRYTVKARLVGDEVTDVY